MYRQINTALQAGKLDEAWNLLQNPSLRRHQNTQEYLLRCGIAFLARAKQLGKQNNLDAALKDLKHAREAGVAQANIDLVKNELVNLKLSGVQSILDQGQPSEALALIEAMRHQPVSQQELEQYEQTARAWLVARDHAQQGEFLQAIQSIERVAYQKVPALVNLHAEWKRRQVEFPTQCDQLHQAVEQQHWRQVVKLADDLLALAPEHAAIRKARTKAWRMLEPPTVLHGPDHAVAAPAQDKANLQNPIEDAPRRLLCWIDGVGGYLLCLSPRVSLGRATGDATVDIPLFADVSRLHAYLNRDKEGGYVLEAVRQVQVNGKPVEKVVLKDGDVLTLGTACKIRFRQPLAVSGTARLELISRHRLPLSIDGVLLMSDACLMGDHEGTHVMVPGLSRPLAIVRNGDSLAIQCSGPYEIDGQACKGRTPVTMKSTICADEVRLKLESVGPRFLGN